ncbi:MAG TPA: hypothetical protein VGF97_04455 [Rhizomicrobium sp.]|jgi:hypothetical protein
MPVEASKSRTASGHKGRHRIGSDREKVHRLFDLKGEQAALQFATKSGLDPDTVRRWLGSFAKSSRAAKPAPPARISIRDLQKISGEAIRGLRGPTPIKSGETTVALLIPLTAADPYRLAAVLGQAEALAKSHDAAIDDVALAQFGDVDPVNWSGEEVRKLKGGRGRR